MALGEWFAFTCIRKHARAVRHRREDHRLDVIALIEQEPPSPQRRFLLADEHRNDRHQAAQNGQTESVSLPRPAGERWRRARPRSRSYSGETITSSAAQTATRYAGGTGPPKMSGFDRNFSTSIAARDAGDEPAQARQRLRERSDDERVVVAAEGVEHGAAALRPSTPVPWASST